MLNADIEKKRIVYALNNLMNAPEAADLGVGDLKDDRLTRAIDVIAEAYELKTKPTAAKCSTARSCRPRPIGKSRSRRTDPPASRHALKTREAPAANC